MFAAIGQVARIGEKEIAGADLAAVVAGAAGQHAKRRQLRQHIAGGRVGRHKGIRPAHNLAFVAGLALCATSSGASGAMPSVRKVPAITAANTGAATSPP
jgi:hypothetical protein